MELGTALIVTQFNILIDNFSFCLELTRRRKEIKIIIISNLFGYELSTWMKANEFFCLCNIVAILRKSSVFGTWKVDALFKV